MQMWSWHDTLASSTLQNYGIFSSFIIYVILTVYFQINKSSFFKKRQPAFSESGAQLLRGMSQSRTFPLTLRLTGSGERDVLHFYVFKLNFNRFLVPNIYREPAGEGRRERRLGGGKVITVFIIFRPRESYGRGKNGLLCVMDGSAKKLLHS